MPEVWQPIPGFDGYEASSEGRIRSPRRILKPSRSGKYLNAWIAGEKRYIHSLVALAFYGPRPDGAYCCHRNDQPHDNRASNLYWGTNSSNQLDRVRNGKPRTRTVLTVEQVAEIKRQLVEGVSQYALAKQFGVSQTAICNIKTGRRWSSVPCA